MDIFLAVGSFALFHILRHGVASSSLTPTSVRLQGKVTIWKWVNTVDSLVHSFVTGVGAMICFYLYPETADDVVTVYSPLSHGLTAFSIGYFVFDFFDMLLNHKKRSSYELMLHHAFVVSCFGVSMWNKRYLGFVMVSLVIEVNSVFLHWRQLLLLCHTRKTLKYYRTVSVINLCSFLLFRIVPLGWMTRWLAINSHQVSSSVHLLGCIAISTVVLMSIVLFQRILKADFRPNNLDMASASTTVASTTKKDHTHLS